MPEELTRFELWSLGVQTAGVVVVAVYTLVAWLQVKALLASNETNRQALEETRRSNEHTAESNRIQQEAMIIANRAWLGLGGLERLAPLNSTATGLNIVVRNTGRSPASKIIGISTMALNDEPLTKVPEPEPTPGTANSIPVVFPDSAMDTTLAAGAPQLTDQDVSAIKEGKTFLYYYGTFTYEDAFSNARKTCVCLYYNSASGSWDYASFGNSAS